MDFATKKGTVKLTSPTSSEVPVGVVDSDIRSELNSVEIEDNPYNTYGLASKWMVFGLIKAHDESDDAHSGLFSKFLSQLYDLYEEQGELKINAISDDSGNKIYANRKVVINGDVDNPKYIVCSNSRNQDYDELLARVSALEERLGIGG